MASASGVEGVMPTAGQFGPAHELEDTTEMTEAELKKIFNHFDSDGSGSIDNDELRSAMMALGIKVTISTAKKILAIIDLDGNGTVEWDEFITFFDKVKNKDEMKALLSQANSKYMEYKEQVLGDPNFQSRFYVPSQYSRLLKFQGHQDNVETVKWLNKTTDEFLSCSLDGCVLLWNASNEKATENAASNGKDLKPEPPTTVVVKDQPGGVYGIDVLASGKEFVGCLGARDGQPNVCLYDISGLGGEFDDDAGDIIKMKYKGPDVPMYSIAAEKNSKPAFMFAGAKNGHMCYFDLQKGPEPVVTLDSIHEGVVNCVDFHPDCRTVCSGSTDGLVQIMDLRAAGQWKAAVTIEDAAAGEVVHGALWRGDKEIVSCGDDFCVKKWDIRKLKNGPIENYFGHTSPVRAMALSPCQKFCISSTNDGTIRLWILDERIYLKEEFNTINNKVEKLETERRVIDNKLQKEFDGEDNEDFDFEKMEQKQQEDFKLDESLRTRIVPELEKSYNKSNFLHGCINERESMNCVQARVGLEGHSLPTTSLAWRDSPDDKNRCQILSGAQDQNAAYYEIKKPNHKVFPKWGTTDDSS